MSICCLLFHWIRLPTDTRETDHLIASHQFHFVAPGLEEEVGVKESSKILSVSHTGGQSGQRLPEVPITCTSIHHQVASKKQKTEQCPGVGMGAHQVLLWQDLKHSPATQTLSVCGHGSPAWALSQVRLPGARLHTGVQPKPSLPPKQCWPPPFFWWCWLTRCWSWSCAFATTLCFPRKPEAQQSRSLHAEMGQNISLQETAKQKITRNSVLFLQDSKCKELSLNHYILILQIKDQFLPLQSKQFIEPAYHTQ